MTGAALSRVVAKPLDLTWLKGHKESGLCALAERLEITMPVFLYFFIFVNMFRHFLLADGRLQLKLVLQPNMSVLFILRAPYFPDPHWFACSLIADGVERII